jgi:serine/threonine-protein kinase RsbW
MHWEPVAAPADGMGFLDRLEATMEALRYSASDILAVRFAAEEAISNALRHGRMQPDEPVRVRFVVSPECALVDVEDSGTGFDPDQVPDPQGLATQQGPHGWGLFLMRRYMTWVRFNERGNRVTLCRRRSAADGLDPIAGFPDSSLVS